MQEEKIEGAKVEATVPKEKKTAKSRKPKLQSGVFPHESFVNPYGFIHLSNGVAEAFGAPKGTKTPIRIDLKDGNLIISKA